MRGGLAFPVRELALEDVAEVDHAVPLVRHLDAHRLLARDRSQDADVGRGERVGDVVLQLRHLRHLRARREPDLVPGHARPRHATDDLGLDAEVTQRLDQQLRDLLLVRRVGRLRAGRAAEHRGLGKLVVELLGLRHGRAAAPHRRELQLGGGLVLGLAGRGDHLPLDLLQRVVLVGLDRLRLGGKRSRLRLVLEQGTYLRLALGLLVEVCGAVGVLLRVLALARDAGGKVA
jgi:hypothetical protein